MNLNFVIILCIIIGHSIQRPPPVRPTRRWTTKKPIGYTITKASDGPLCKEPEENYKILSIFTLVNDTFFHIKEYLKVGKEPVHFYKLQVANHNDSDMSIPQSFTENSNAEQHLKDLLGIRLKLDSPIVGFILPMWSKYCAEPDDSAATALLCRALRTSDKNRYVVCFVGDDLSSNLGSVTLFYTVNEMETPFHYTSGTPIIYNIAKVDCQNEALRLQPEKGHRGTAVSLLNFNWTDNRNAFSSITVRQHSLMDVGIVIPRTPDTPSKLLEIEQYFYVKDVWFVFSFNYNYQFLFCGKKCELNTTLLWMELGKDGILREPATEDFLTLRKLLRCDERDDYLLNIPERLEDKSDDPKTIIHDISNEGPLCAEDTDFEIISIFSLVDETFIHTKDRNGKIEIWRIWGAYNTLQENDNEMPFTVTEKHYSDERMTKFLDAIFDLKKQIKPYVLPLYEYLQTECSQLQLIRPNISTSPFSLTNIGCSVLDKYLNERFYLVCMEGIGRNSGVEEMVWLTLDKTSQQFKYIHDLGLLERVKFFCQKNTLLNDTDVADGALVSFSNWESKANPYVWNNISLIRNPLNKNYYMKAIVKINVNGQPYRLNEQIFNEFVEYPWFIFRLNTHYKHLFCGKNCSLDSPLIWRDYTIRKGETKISHIIYPKARPTIRKLLGCKKRYHPFVIPFDPNKFCDTKEKFLSFFNLGEDLYFQRSGRFWRYRPPVGKNYELFTNDANLEIQTKIGFITYESEVTELLSKTFETSLPIVGFTFIMYEIDLCLPYEGKSTECGNKYYRSGQDFRTCIYGYTEDVVNPNQKKFNSSTFMYSSSGMRPFRTDEKGLPLSIEIETRNYCELLYSGLGIKYNFDLKQFILTSTVNPGYFYNNNSKLFNQVFFVLTHRVLPNYYRLFAIKWSYDQTLPKDVYEREYEIKEIRKQIRSSILFTFGAKIFGFMGEVNEPLFEITPNPLANDFNEYTIELESTSKKIFDLVDCPVNTTTSLMTLGHKETPCQYKRSTDTESIFMMAETLYHQVGQYFYRYDRQTHQFLYDKYMSELLNQYFDTTYRVTGYSVKDPDSVYEERYKVVIHGRSNYQFREYDKYLIGAFHIYPNDPFYKLRAISKPKQFDYRVDWTLGVSDWIKSLDNRTSILAIHHRRNTFYSEKHIPLLTLIVEKLSHPIDDTGSQPNTDNIREYNISYTHAVNEEMFVFNQLNQFDETDKIFPNKNRTPLWTHYSYVTEDTKGDILGITEFDNGFQFMVFNKEATRTFYTLGTRQQGLFLQLEFHYRAQYCSNVSEFRCQEKGDTIECLPHYYRQNNPNESKSESSPKILYKCLAFVVLVLLITALIVGFIVSYNTQKYFKEPTNPRVDTSQPNQPNDTVVRHPESKPVESESKEPSLEKTVRSDEI